MPIVSSDRVCCGSQNSAWMGSIDCSEADRCPRGHHLPQLDLPDRQPALEGSPDGLLGDGGLQRRDVGGAALARDSATSRSAGALEPAARRARARARLARPGPRRPVRRPSCASSTEVSSFTNMSSRLTKAPESKPISRTNPATSDERMTPATATSVPTAGRDALPFHLLHLRGGHRLGRRRKRLAGLDHGGDLGRLDPGEDDDDGEQREDRDDPDPAPVHPHGGLL